MAGTGKSVHVHWLALTWLSRNPTGRAFWLDIKCEETTHHQRLFIRRPEPKDVVSKERTQAWVHRWCAHLFAECRPDAPILVIVDEAPWCMVGHEAPEGLMLGILRGRTRGWSYVLVAQRPNGIPADIRGQAQHLHFFALTEKLDVDAAKHHGVDAAQVQLLPVGTYLHAGRGIVPHLHHGAMSLCT